MSYSYELHFWAAEAIPRFILDINFLINRCKLSRRNCFIF